MSATAETTPTVAGILGTLGYTATDEGAIVPDAVSYEPLTQGLDGTAGVLRTDVWNLPDAGITLADALEYTGHDLGLNLSQWEAGKVTAHVWNHSDYGRVIAFAIEVSKPRS